MNYKFLKNNKFLKYINEIFPRPTNLLLEKKKRKFYKKNIDKNFEINFDDLAEKVF